MLDPFLLDKSRSIPIIGNEIAGGRRQKHTDLALLLRLSTARHFLVLR
jgi:hypothetical protein